MENCLKLLPHKSYNTFGLVLLTLFVSFGVVAVGIAASFDSKAALLCNPDKTIASDLSTRKYIGTQCSLKYAKEFNHFLPLHVLVVINIGIVLLLSIVYGYSVKHRVECYSDPSSSTTENANNAEDQSQPLISKAASNPIDYQNNSGSYVVFMVYIIYLIICRMIPLVVFAVLLLNSSNFPIEFQCSWPTGTRGTSYANITLTQNTNFTIVDCTYPIGGRNEKLASTVIAVNFLYSTITFMELAYLLWSTWKDNSLLTDMEFCSVYILRKRKRIRKLMKKIRKGIRDDTFKLHDDFGEKQLSHRKLEEMYVNVIIQDGRETTNTSRRRYENRHETYEAHLKAPPDATVLKTIEDLFKHNPRTILVVGRPGIGKSILTTKIFYQWKKQKHKLWQDKIVILIRFRTFNHKETSLREMLHYADGFNMSPIDFRHIYEYICLKPNNVVLLFDGLDELKVDEFSRREKAVKSHYDVAHIRWIFKKLVRGEFLHGVTVLTTSRPTAEGIYKPLEFDREVEILGFKEEEIREYVQKFCLNDLNKSKKIWDHIKDSPELLSLCYIPVNAQIVCLTLTETIKGDIFEETGYNLQSNVPRTITELYKRAVKILLFKHNSKYKDVEIPKGYIIAKLPEPLQNDLNEFKEIARNGMIKNELIFEFKSEDIFDRELSNCGLFNQLDDKRKNIYCFLHLTIQEFLTAQYVVDKMESVEAFLSENMKDPRWHLVIQFVAGLIGDKIRELKAEESISERSAEKRRIIDQICKRFQDYIPKAGRINGRLSYTLLVIKCIHEIQDVDLMKSIASFLNDDGEGCKIFSLCNLNIAPMESTALFEFLCYVKNLYKLRITDCIMDDLVLSELGKLFTKSNKITDLEIKGVTLTENCVKCIADALRNKDCKLAKLNLDNSELTNVDVKYLCDVLKSDSCKLTKLDISNDRREGSVIRGFQESVHGTQSKINNRLTDERAYYLADVLKSDNCKLTELTIRNNPPTNNGASYLAEALKSDSCKLTGLNVSDNSLTDESAKYLTDALKTGNCKLTKLNIKNNMLTDKVAEYLADALKTDNCKLTKLNIRNNVLTGEGANYLADALKTDSCQLIELNLSDNLLTDKGAKYLVDAVNTYHCKLTGLNIRYIYLTDKGAKYLADILTTDNCKLIKLDISSNRLTDEGAKYFADALKTDNCKLTELNISDNRLTDEAANCLADAVQTDNCKLTELDISNIYLTDKGAKYLADALKTYNCKLTELNISNNGLTDEGAKYLADALKTDNCKLTELNISNNRVTEEGGKYLVDAVKTGNCQFTKLNISDNYLTINNLSELSSSWKNSFYDF